MSNNKIFTANMFTPTQFHSAQDKADFANKFIRFVESGFKKTLFTKKFYERLSNCFGHIAHYNQAGFYDTWFYSFDEQVAFLNNALTHPIYGDAAYTYSDVEQQIRSVIRDRKMIQGITSRMLLDKMGR